MAGLLHLGLTDAEVAMTAEGKRKFFDLYHHPHGFAGEELRFRDDSRNAWRPLKPVEGSPVRELTTLLQATGFMPHAAHDGIYGYVTQAAVRLFQEYVRTIDDPLRHAVGMPPSWPDGVVGSDTRYYLDRWRLATKHCRWGSTDRPTEDFADWIATLGRIIDRYRESPTALLKQIAGLPRRGDTLLPAEWSNDSNEPHLIGIRRSAEEPRNNGAERPADDLFVLLINGRSFYFAGSTDANPSAGREGYLTEGQHRYRFNWHHIGARTRHRIYKAARPAGAGVIVLRDVHGHNALTEANRRDGLDPTPNPTFNIHWNGIGRSNWSAGCQVISGRAYLNDEGEYINCSDYTARNAAERGKRRHDMGPRMTMGAYTLLSDLLLCYTPQQKSDEKPTFRYTLLREEELSRAAGLDRAALKRKVDLLRGD